MALPIFFTISWNLRNAGYLRVANEEGELYFDAESLQDLSAKFAVELAQTEDRSLVHLRNCYNNKYVRRRSAASNEIVASADKPEEDRSIWSCTLFKPVAAAGRTSPVQFTHVQSGLFVARVAATSQRPSRLILSNLGTFLDITDLETLVFLPKRVAFKGDNGKYLSARFINRKEYLQFASDDITDPTVRFEATMTKDGSYRFKSSEVNKFWRLSPAEIWISVDAAEDDAQNTFRPSKINNHVITLRYGRSFCRRFSDQIIDGLAAIASTAVAGAQLEVEEFVLSRRIDNVVYNLSHSRIYNERALMVATAEAINKTQEPNQVQLHFAYREFTSSTWNNEVSVSAGVFAQFRFGVPVLARGRIEISAEVNAEWQWGETRETTTEVTTTYDVTVPPMKTMRVRLLATEASFDVPFSYVQRDFLVDGREVTYQTDGGVFTGVNSYNFRYETEEEELTTSSELTLKELSPEMQGTKNNVPRSAL